MIALSRWLHERRNEHYYVQAKQQGYRSRASFKIKQLDDRFHFFEGAARVLDLGAAPGGWLQVASEALGEDGLIIGVDLKEIEPLDADNVETIAGDVTDPAVQEEILARFDGKADVILSDMAPNVTGIWELDDLRQIHLARITLVIADRLLKQDGWVVVKVFQGPEFDSYVRDIKAMLGFVQIVKPAATRKKSAEVYIVARELKPDRVLPEEWRPKSEEPTPDPTEP